MADASADPFRAGRANLRDTAKWLIAASAGAASLIVGSSTFSQLGAMDLRDHRLWVAVLAVIVAAGLCWIPFTRAIDVLRSDLVSLHKFASATSGDFKAATDDVSALLGTLPEGCDLRAFAARFPQLRTDAWNAAPDAASKAAAIADLDARFDTYREACSSQLVAIRFQHLVAALWRYGWAILLSFLVFAYAANPPKDALTLTDKPILEPLGPERIGVLTAAGVKPACLPGAQLLVVATPDSGARIALLMPPPGGPADCAVRRVRLEGGRILHVD
jgi:hypothetical protein